MGREGDDRGWDGWMASLTWWTLVWASSSSRWWTGRPAWRAAVHGVAKSWTWLSNWTELNWTGIQVNKSYLPPSALFTSSLTSQSFPLVHSNLSTCFITIIFSTLSSLSVRTIHPKSCCYICIIFGPVGTQGAAENKGRKILKSGASALLWIMHDGARWYREGCIGVRAVWS